VPLFLEQLAAHAVESELAVDHVPATLDALLASRIDGLEPGERAVVSRAAVVGRAFQSIAHDIRSRYTVAYAPPDSVIEGHLRRVRVVIEAPGRTGLKVRTRNGYVVDSSTTVSAGPEVTR